MHKVLLSSFLVLLAAGLSFYGCNDNTLTPGNGPQMPVAASYPLSGTCVNTFVKNLYGTDYAFVSLYSNGVQILNVNNPGSPTAVGSFTATGNTDEVSVYIKDTTAYAFLAAGVGGVTVLNLYNISSPVQDTVISFPGDTIYSVFADSSSGILYAGGSGAKVYIMNLSNLPVVTTTTIYAGSGASNINEIQVQNNIAYIAEDNGLEILNVTNPLNPVRYSQGISDDYAYDVKVSGAYAYIANNMNGVLVLNVSNPANPSQVSYLPTSDIGLACAINGNIVYVAEDATGVEAFDVSNPANPTYMANYITNTYSEHVFSFKGYTYVSDYDKLVVLKYP